MTEREYFGRGTASILKDKTELASNQGAFRELAGYADKLWEANAEALGGLVRLSGRLGIATQDPAWAEPCDVNQGEIEELRRKITGATAQAGQIAAMLKALDSAL